MEPWSYSRRGRERPSASPYNHHQVSSVAPLGRLAHNLGQLAQLTSSISNAFDADYADYAEYQHAFERSPPDDKAAQTSARRVDPRRRAYLFGEEDDAVFHEDEMLTETPIMRNNMYSSRYQLSASSRSPLMVSPPSRPSPHGRAVQVWHQLDLVFKALVVKLLESKMLSQAVGFKCQPASLQRGYVLRTLDLSGRGLLKLPGLVGLQHVLEDLNVSRNRLTRLEGARARVVRVVAPRLSLSSMHPFNRTEHPLHSPHHHRRRACLFFRVFPAAPQASGAAAACAYWRRTSTR